MVERIRIRGLRDADISVGITRFRCDASVLDVARTCSRVDNESLLFALPARVHAFSIVQQTRVTSGRPKSLGKKAVDVCRERCKSAMAVTGDRERRNGVMLISRERSQ